jgi:hypothetical protein
LILGFTTRRRALRKWAALGTAVAIGSLLSASIVQANLAGSTFEGNDGNMIVNTAGNTDWINAPNRVSGNDLPTGKTDNSFGQGTKEDNTSVTVVSGSIPPNKNDLTRFYVGSEFTGGNNFLYLAWERLVNIGNANLDFEINQATQPNLTTTGAKTLNRTAGDLLVTYDFGGSGAPTLGLLRWVTSGAASQCFSANTTPCWGNRVDLTAAGDAEGAVNTTSISEAVAGGNLGVGLFGEAAINLTAAGVFPPGTCTAFGSTFVKSRSSSSFPAEIKDFIAPVPVNITNCGTIIIHKVTVNGDGTFGYTTTGGLTPSTFNLSNGGTQSYLGTVPAGSYSVTESTLPANWTLTDLTCSASGGASDGTSGATVSITMVAGGTVECTYTNTKQLGAIQVTKTRKHAADGPGDHPQSGVDFTVNGVTHTTDANGIACFDGLAFGDYTVHETTPAGYVGEADKTVTVNTSASCSDATYTGNTVSFHNTPLTDITVSVNSQVDGGTSSTITCDGGIGTGSTGANGDGSLTGTDLEPGTYTCTVVVDP